MPPIAPARKMNIVRAMRACPEAHCYEGAAPDGRSPSGRYYLSNQADPRISISQAEVDELVADGTLKLDFPGFYKLADVLREGTARD